MTFKRILPLCLLCLAGAASAQIPGLGGLKTGLPDVTSMGAGNAAGVLSYCVKNNLLGGTDASSVLGGLTKKPEVQSSKDFSAGQAGNLLTGGGSSFSLDGVQGQMKSQLCSQVLKQAKTFL